MSSVTRGPAAALVSSETSSLPLRRPLRSPPRRPLRPPRRPRQPPGWSGPLTGPCAPELLGDLWYPTGLGAARLSQESAPESPALPLAVGPGLPRRRGEPGLVRSFGRWPPRIGCLGGSEVSADRSRVAIPVAPVPTGTAQTPGAPVPTGPVSGVGGPVLAPIPRGSIPVTRVVLVRRGGGATRTALAARKFPLGKSSRPWPRGYPQNLEHNCAPADCPDR